MNKLLISLAAAAALAVPSSALAWGGHHHGGRLGAFAFGGDNDHSVMFAKLSGTGASFGGATTTVTGSIVAGNDHPNGHFSVSLSTTWSSATTKTFTDNDGDADDGTYASSCAPATASITLSNGSTSTSALTGKTCSSSFNGTVKGSGFFGADSAHTVHLFLKQDSSGNVTGAAITRIASSGQSDMQFGFRLGAFARLANR
jgi:hypothetical protein